MTVKSREESSNVTYAEEPSTKKKKKTSPKLPEIPTVSF